jgi:hypothetical protein
MGAFARVKKHIAEASPDWSFNDANAARWSCGK